MAIVVLRCLRGIHDSSSMIIQGLVSWPNCSSMPHVFNAVCLRHRLDGNVGGEGQVRQLDCHHLRLLLRVRPVERVLLRLLNDHLCNQDLNALNVST